MKKICPKINILCTLHRLYHFRSLGPFVRLSWIFVFDCLPHKLLLVVAIISIFFCLCFIVFIHLARRVSLHLCRRQNRTNEYYYLSRPPNEYNRYTKNTLIKAKQSTKPPDAIRRHRMNERSQQQQNEKNKKYYTHPNEE